MPKKFHMSKDGQLRECRASVKPCTLQHIEAETLNDAWMHLADSGKVEAFSQFSKNKGKTFDASAKRYAPNTLLSTVKVTQRKNFEDLQEEALKATLEGKYAILSRKYYIELSVPPEEVFKDPDWGDDDDDDYSDEEKDEMIYEKQMEYMNESYGGEKNLYLTMPSDIVSVAINNDVEIFDDKDHFESFKRNPERYFDSQDYSEHFSYDNPNNDGWMASSMEFEFRQPGLAGQEELYFYEPIE